MSPAAALAISTGCEQGVQQAEHPAGHTRGTGCDTPPFLPLPMALPAWTHSKHLHCQSDSNNSDFTTCTQGAACSDIFGLQGKINQSIQLGMYF